VHRIIAIFSQHKTIPTGGNGHEKICKFLNLIRTDLLVYGEKWTFSGVYGHRNKGISIERKHFAQIIN